MSFKCKIGIHSWDGCICSDCGKIRDYKHDLSNDCEKCSRCGKEFDNQHDWSKDCEKCSKCGKTREGYHVWSHDCEKCSKCGKIRKDSHRIVDDICQICGKGTFIDKSNGKKYKIIKIGKQIIMAENFAKKPEEGNCWVYDDDEYNANKYGYLYDFETAKSIKPEGWHLPSKAEWETLFTYLGGDAHKVYEHAKDSGFNCMYAGYRYVRGAYNSLMASGHYWSDTAEGENEAWHFKLCAYDRKAEFEKSECGLGLSVRFFKDDKEQLQKEKL